ncbi:hypothetical protein KT99_00171 [Shewanella benthica KT99]|uniref:Uncharacterized protein n=1 Tax=Shewanella benthica KT99 TaxID=314608 RepID=A9DJC8_9GAMM|nr:hypothetical protein KT99_00171 [Shewanella benthica KT99]
MYITESDTYFYVYSVIAPILYLTFTKKTARERISIFIGMQGITIWTFYFMLPIEYNIITNTLSIIRGYLLVIFIAIELWALIYFYRKYSNATKTLGLLPEEAFLHALTFFPLPSEMLKLYSVEFNNIKAFINLFKFNKNIKEQPFKINSGYSLFMYIAILVFLTIAFSASIWLLDGYWALLPSGVTLYLFLLVNCDYSNLKDNSIVKIDNTIRIPNGIFGFIRIDIENISSINILKGNKSYDDVDVKVHRLIKSNLVLELSKPIVYFGVNAEKISISVKPEHIKKWINLK